MAVFRKVHCSFWSDPFIADLNQQRKLFYLYILTNERTKQCGIYEISKKQISYDLGYSIDIVSNLIEYFSKIGKIKYNETTKELAVKNWLKFNGSTSPKVKTCIYNELKLVKDRVLIEYLKSMDTLSQEEEEEEEEEKEEEKLFEAPPHPLVKWLSENCKEVSRMKKPLTNDEAAKLVADFTKEEIKDTFLNMENYKPLLTKSVSAYLTCRKWITKDRKEKGGVIPTGNMMWAITQ
jgi:hypothetical protein